MVKTHFQCGHPYTEENSVYVKKGKGKDKRRRCKICLRERERNYRAGRREIMRPKLAKYSRDFFQNHRQKVYLYAQKYRQKQKDIVIDHYKAKCACCGETIREFLCVDHVNNDGNKHRREMRNTSGSSIYHWLILNEFPDGFQLLCYNCNMAKSIYGICPHQTR